MDNDYVLVHGVWDLLHHGHVAHLAAAKAMGPPGCLLVISVTGDDYVNKGPGRPVFNAHQRMKVLWALDIVDIVTLTEAPSAVPAILKFRPVLYVKGQEYQTEDIAGNLEAEQAAVEEVGGQVAFTDCPGASSSSAINKALPVLPAPAEPFMEDIRGKYTFGDVQALFGKAGKLDAGILGERIIDEYVPVEPAGKSPKENLITYVRNGEVLHFEGGAGVITAHLNGLVGSVYFPECCQGRTPVLKSRRVQTAFTSKVFSEAVVPNEGPLTGEPDDMYTSDMLVVADFGHGLFDKRTAERVSSRARGSDVWLALTCQTNSLNFGFNRLSKWESCDYLAVDEGELRLNYQDRTTPLADLAVEEGGRLGATVVAITSGHKGSLLVRKGGRAITVPALNTRPVDRMGAGDAFLAYTAPFVRLGAPLDMAGLIGNAAAAVHISRPGNDPLNKREVLGFLKALLA